MKKDMLSRQPSTDDLQEKKKNRFFFKQKKKKKGSWNHFIQNVSIYFRGRKNVHSQL